MLLFAYNTMMLARKKMAHRMKEMQAKEASQVAEVAPLNYFEMTNSAKLKKTCSSHSPQK